jgi:transcription initiation factor TFIIB
MATSAPPSNSGTACPECNGRVRPHGIERVCSQCALVVDTDRIDRGPDWGRDDTDAPWDSGKHAKAAAPELADGGLGSVAPDLGVTDAAEWQDRLTRNRAYATSEIRRIGSALELGLSTVREAQRTFVRLHKRDAVVGKDMDVLAATCLYTTLRKHQRGRTTDEVAAYARCDERPIARRHRWVCDELGLLVPPPDPKQRLRVVAGKLGAAHDTKRRALRAFERVDEAELSRGSHSTLAAAVLYDVGPWTQADVAEAAGVSPKGLRKRWQGLSLDGQTTLSEVAV